MQSAVSTSNILEKGPLKQWRIPIGYAVDMWMIPP